METPEEITQEGRGRSAKKREAKAIEELTERLVNLPESELGKLPLDDELRAELQLARSTKGHSSRRRQIKHFAGLLRRDDQQREQIEAFFGGHQVDQARERQAFHQLEALRDQLCCPTSCTSALEQIRDLWPHIDDRKLASLARSVHDHQDKKAAREIFRRLRKAADDD
jgi:ribosome-associated protein